MPIYVTSVEGGRRELISAQERVVVAGWSEDGKYVLFSAPNVDGFQLWATRLEAGRP